MKLLQKVLQHVFSKNSVSVVNINLTLYLTPFSSYRTLLIKLSLDRGCLSLKHM